MKNRDLRYVTRVYRNSQQLYVYQTKMIAQKSVTQKLENKIIPKLYRLWTTNSITEAEYQQSLRYYNSYILHVSISTLYPNNSEAKKRADSAYAEMMVTYKKRIKMTPQLQTVTPPESVPVTEKTIGDYYSFSKILKEGDSNEEVIRLQTILKRYGYFEGVQPTGYFGSLTKSWLIKFSKEILGMKNPTGIFNEVTRQELLKVVWK